MTSLMPETIEPATGGSAGGPGGTLPLPKVKKARKNWTQADVATLVQTYDAATGKIGVMPARFSREEAVEKLISLGIVAKPEKASLTVQEVEDIETAVGSRTFHFYDEPKRTLALKHAIKYLQAMLPTRVAK